MACAECGWTQGHAPACALGQVTGPLQQVNSGVGALVTGQAEGFAGVQNELALGNVAAFASVYVQTKELAELGQINEKLHALVAIQHQQAAKQQQQMLEQQRQAALQQLLFETEQFVRTVDQVERRDAFAAGVLSALRMEGLNAVGVGPQHLTAIEHKRSLQGAVDQLTAKWNRLTGQDAELGRSCVKAFLDLLRLQRALGDLLGLGAVPAMEAAASERLQRGEREARVGFWLFVAGPVLFVTGLWLVVQGFGSGSRWALVGFGLLLASPFCVTRGGAYFRQARAARTLGRRLVAAVAEYRAFLQRPDGGGVLAAVLAKHPALRG
jgi:hypothetical protein